MELQSSQRPPKDLDLQALAITTPKIDGAHPGLESQATFVSFSSEGTDTPTNKSCRKLLVACILVLVAILGVGVLESYISQHKQSRQADAQSTKPPSRVRRSWKTYTEAEKQHYLSAVQIAMEKGYHYRFVQVHAARINRITSHGACPFLLWHRRFILGYENMLRSLAPEYANLTIPYWNYFEDTNRQLAADVRCNSLESCSQFLRDMGGGGLTDGRAGENMTIEHVELQIGTCVSKGIAGHACNHPNGTASGVCRNCVMRGKWSNPRKIVQALGPDLLSVLDVFNATEEDGGSEGTHAVLSHEIETTFHNAIHTTLNSTMRYTSSPFDPIFMGHHGMVDLAQLIFNRCKYVVNASTVIDWENEPRDTKFDVFKACDVEDERRYNYTAFGNETMHMTFNGVPVNEDPFMAQFFGGFGDKYVDIASAEDLGPENSYTYAIDPYLQQLLERHNVRCPPYLYEPKNTSQSRRLVEGTATAEDIHDAQVALSLVETLTSCGDTIASQHPALSYKKRVEQEGLIKCLVVEAKAGGVLEDYDGAFRSMMKISASDSPYCVKLLRRYRRREVSLLASKDCLRAYGNMTGVDLIAKTTEAHEQPLER